MGRAVAREELVPRLYPQAMELLQRHKRAGRQVYIASSSPEDYLRLLADELAIDGVIGTRAQIVDGRYTGELEGPLVHGPEKAVRVEVSAEPGIDLARSFAYSDSINDLPLLELVGNPVAMNPDHRLRSIARKRGWEVLDFRTARRRTLIASAAGGGAAASAALGLRAGLRGGRTGRDRVPAAPPPSSGPSGSRAARRV